MHFSFTATPLEGLKLVTRQPIGDRRGFLCRLFCAEEFAAAGCGFAVAQINQTLTRSQGAARGLHFQYPPHAEIKLVSCLRGAVYDVAVDLRRGSPTFLHWHGVILSAENRCAYWIPKGFAHGFQTLEPDSELLYLHSSPYQPSSEGGLNLSDPRLAIDWPLPLGDLSERDAALPHIDDSWNGVEL